MDGLFQVFISFEKNNINIDKWKSVEVPTFDLKILEYLSQSLLKKENRDHKFGDGSGIECLLLRIDEVMLRWALKKALV